MAPILHGLTKLDKRSMKVWVLLTVSAFILGGCSHHCYRSHPGALCRTDIQQNVQCAFERGPVEAGEFVDQAWWVFFDDPQLNALIALSLANHPSIHIADARIRRACEESRIARSALYPHLYGVADVKRQKISKLGEGFVPTLPTVVTETTLKLTSAVYELDIWKKNRSLFYAALNRARARVAEFEEAKLLLSTALAAVYFDLQMKLARIALTRERLQAREELYNLHKQQFDLGIIPEFRLFEVDTDVQLLRDLLFLLEQDAAIDQHAIAALTAQTGCLAVKPSAQLARPFPLPTTLPIDLLMRRPDVVAQKWRVEEACFGVKVAKANFFPRIDLLSWIGFQSILIEKLFRGETLIFLAEGAASLPIFTAGKLCAELGVAREDVEIAIEGYNQTVLDAVQQVSDALSELTYADQRQQAVDKSVQDAEALLDLTEQKYTNGIINRLTVLNAMENAYIQKDLRLDIQLARFEAAVDLIRSIGGGYYDCSCP